MRTRIVFTIALSVFLMCSSGVADSGPNVTAVVKGNTEFCFDLYQELRVKEGNIFISPYSISTALAMTYGGARNLTEKEMAEVLHFPLEQESLHAAFSGLQSHLNAIQDRGHVKLTVANSLWCQQGYSFLDSFLDLNKRHYGAGLNFVDFVKETEAARVAINEWVEEETQEKIKDMIKKGALDPLTTLVLCNAIYFKGDWQSPFEKRNTREAVFHVTAKDNVKVQMMTQTTFFKHKDFGEFSAIEMLYKGYDLSMVVLLPKEIDGLPQLETSLTDSNATGWITDLLNSPQSDVILSIPKFKTTYDVSLAKTLGGMGMPSVFSNADFSGMTGKKDLFVDDVLHKAFVSVDEKGTEAAAATAIMAVGAGAPSKPLIFRVDHPFIFLIRENSTGSILFIGRIIDPTK